MWTDFITLAGYGWWTWTHGGGPGSSVLPVRRTSRTEWIRPAPAGVVGTPKAGTSPTPCRSDDEHP